MIKVVDLVETSFLSLGVLVAISDIREILSIILLIVNGVWLICKFLIKFINYCKDGKLTDEEIEDLKKFVNKEDNNNGKD